jgi:sucrose synthase
MEKSKQPIKVLEAEVETIKGPLFALLRGIDASEQRFWLPTELHRELNRIDPGGEQKALRDFLWQIQELIVYPPRCYAAIRTAIGRWEYAAFDVEAYQFIGLKRSAFLSFKERLVGAEPGGWRLRFDSEPFNMDFPKVPNERFIGSGIDSLNAHLAGDFFDRPKKMEKFFEFLSVHGHGGRQFLINGRLEGIAKLQEALTAARAFLSKKKRDAPYESVCYDLQSLGFEPGWGDTIGRTLETMALLEDVIKTRKPEAIEAFLSRVPMIFKVLIVSPHGFFAQSGVLGFPDTGGQVVYILDQVRALEKHIQATLDEAGLSDIQPEIVVLTRQIPNSRGTTCHERHEPIWGAKSARILRVPFRNSEGEVLSEWVSRFHIWGHLEGFAFESEREILAEFGGRPDLIVGNYSDGNLVATLLAQRLQVTQCAIAHALEKTKYLFSDLYWRENAEQYNFQTQFTADLIGMNAADFIITSTYQEIAGGEESIGQYESYQTFALPGLYQVVSGTDVYDTRFNIISPGANAEVFFPYYENDRRLSGLREEAGALLFGEADETIRGQLAHPDRPIIFSMARLDRIKNITALVEWFGASDRLRNLANLVIVAGHVDIEKSGDDEERAQIARMHELFDHYKLDQNARWVGRTLEKQFTGELYRTVADTRGVFVQPALFEAFGLTVIEAMSTGLPTFATFFGGPLEIIEEGVSGYHLDPTDSDQATGVLLDFFEKQAENPKIWDRLSQNAIARVDERYNWPHYAERMLTLAKVYGFWKHVTNKDREEMRRYLEMFYGLMYRPLAMEQ